MQPFEVLQNQGEGDQTFRKVFLVFLGLPQSPRCICVHGGNLGYVITKRNRKSEDL